MRPRLDRELSPGELGSWGLSRMITDDSTATSTSGRALQQPDSAGLCGMTGLSPETGRDGGPNGAALSAPLCYRCQPKGRCRGLSEAARKKLGWDRRARPLRLAAWSGSGQQGEGLRLANLAADYVRTSVVVGRAVFNNPPGYNSLAANQCRSASNGRQARRFVRDRNGNPVDQRTARSSRWFEKRQLFRRQPERV